MNFEPLAYPLDLATCNVVSYYGSLGPSSKMVGQIFHVNPLLVTKNGNLLHAISRYQFLYDKFGRVRLAMHAPLPQCAIFSFPRSLGQMVYQLY